MDRDVEKQPTEPRQHRIADVAVKRRHRSGSDPASKPVTHHEVGATAEPLDEWLQGVECVAVVCISHDHELAARVTDACSQGSAVAALRHAQQPCP